MFVANRLIVVAIIKSLVHHTTFTPQFVLAGGDRVLRVKISYVTIILSAAVFFALMI